METVVRTLVTIVCESSMEDQLCADLLRCGAHGYTVGDARGRGAHGLRAANWAPSGNIRIEVICEEQVAQAIAQHLQSRYYRDYAMVMWLADVRVLRATKF